MFVLIYLLDLLLGDLCNDFEADIAPSLAQLGSGCWHYSWVFIHLPATRSGCVAPRIAVPCCRTESLPQKPFYRAPKKGLSATFQNSRDRVMKIDITIGAYSGYGSRSSTLTRRSQARLFRIPEARPKSQL